MITWPSPVRTARSGVQPVKQPFYIPLPLYNHTHIYVLRTNYEVGSVCFSLNSAISNPLFVYAKPARIYALPARLLKCATWLCQLSAISAIHHLPIIPQKEQICLRLHVCDKRNLYAATFRVSLKSIRSFPPPPLNRPLRRMCPVLSLKTWQLIENGSSAGRSGRWWLLLRYPRCCHFHSLVESNDRSVEGITSGLALSLFRCYSIPKLLSDPMTVPDSRPRPHCCDVVVVSSLSSVWFIDVRGTV